MSCFSSSECKEDDIGARCNQPRNVITAPNAPVSAARPPAPRNIPHMADYSAQIEALQAAAEVCQRHSIKTGVNGVQPDYPRWPNAWAACERVWRAWLEVQTMARDGSDEEDRDTVIREANRLRGW
jgi:hypothetical protein